MLIFSIKGISSPQNEIPSYPDLFYNNPDEILNRWRADYIHAKLPMDRVDILINVSEVYRIKGNYKLMLDFIQRAEHEAKEIDDKLLQHDIVSFLAYDYSLVNLLSKADSLTKLQVELAMSIEDKNEQKLALLDAYSQFGTIKRKQYQYREALVNYKKGLGILDSIQNLSKFNYYDRKGGLLNNIAVTFLDNNDVDSAKYYLDKIDLHQLKIIPRLKGVIEQTYGSLFYIDNDFELAEKYLMSSLEIFKAHGYSEKEIKSFKLLAEINKSKRDYKLASYFQGKYDEQIKKMNINKSEAIELEINKIEAGRNKIIKDRERREIAYILSIVVICSLFSFLLYRLVKNHKKQKEIKIQHFEKVIAELEKSLSPIKQAPEDATILKKRIIDVPANTKEKILKQLRKFEASEKSFTNPKMSLSLLASQLGTNTNYLSEIVNQTKGMNFNSYINKLRIDFICKKIIEEPRYRTYKISYLAEISGFTSHSVFTKTFTSITNVSPSYFIEKSTERSDA